MGGWLGGGGQNYFFLQATPTYTEYKKVKNFDI